MGPPDWRKGSTWVLERDGGRVVRTYAVPCSPVSSTQLLVVDDLNYPFSNGRSRSATNERTGPLAPDDNEIFVVQPGEVLHVARATSGRQASPPRPRSSTSRRPCPRRWTAGASV